MVILFSAINTLKNLMISAIYLIALWVNVSVVQAQEQLTSQLNTDSNPQPSTVTASTSEPLTAKNSQRAEIVAALTALNQKYKLLAQRIPLVPLLKDPSKRFDDGDELIFSIIVDNLKLGELFGYKYGQSMRLGLAEFTKALDFPIVASAELTDFKGWYIKPENTFSLKVTPEKTILVTLNNNTEVVELDNFQIEADDIYINAATLGQWFGIDISYDYVSLKIRLNPQQKLPIQTRLERQTRTVDSNNRRRVVLNPLKDNTYQALSPQTLDVVINASTNKDEVSSGYSVLGVRDFAYMKSEFYASGNDQTPVMDARLTFSKMFDDDRLMNGVISHIQFGDIAPIRTGGISIGELSRGVSVTNRPISGSEEINVTSFKGDIQIGWDVELYRNSILLASKYNVADGRYDFDDIPLYFGNNIFEIVFYGPQGEIKREKIEKLVDRTLQNKKGIFSFSLNELDTTLFGINDDEPELDSGFLAAAKFERGITDTLSMNLGLNGQFGGDIRVNTASLGANMKVFDQVLLGSTLQFSDNNTQSMSATARTKINQHAISTGMNIYKTYDPISGKELVSKQLRGEMSGRLMLGDNFPNVAYQNAFVINDVLNNKSKQWTTGLSSRILNTTINTGLSYIETDTLDEGTQSNRELSLNFQRSLGPVFVNFQSIYDFSLGDIRSLGTQLNYNISNDVKSRFIYQHSLLDNRDSYSVDLNWRHDDFSLSSKYQYSDLIGWKVGLFIRFGMGYLGDSQHFIVDRSSLAAKGAILANVYLDNNFNGVFDGNDERLPDVTVEAVQAYKKGVSDDKGIALISGLPDNKITDIKVVRSTLPDPYMLNYEKEFAVRARAGFIEVINIPVVQTSEIDGTIFLNNAIGNEIQFAYAPIHLLDMQDNIIQTVTSEFDGYYLFMDVLPGEYQVLIDSDFIEQRNIQSSSKIRLAISADGQLSSGNDIRLAQVMYEDRFIVSLGQFADPDVMTAFWMLLKQSHQTELNGVQPFFYKTDSAAPTQYLGIALHASKDQALKACNTFSAAGIDCEIIDYAVALTDQTVKGENSET